MTHRDDASSRPISATRHRDKRTNIPPAELSGFATADVTEPKTLLYPRDESLDPQLVWKGKDDLDRDDLAVQAAPIYIQEQIQPQAIVEGLHAQAEAARAQPRQNALFADFNGMTFEERIDFYGHKQKWTNRMILGDSLLIMASLAEKERLRGQVQMIYIDPPYGIKFGSNWQVSTRKREVKDGKTEDVTRQPEQIKAFRDTWELGIHSYLRYLRDRLVLAQDLLTESGSIFVQIGDENVHLVRCLLEEVFGSENFVAQIYFKATTGRQEEHIDRVGNYLLWFAKDAPQLKSHRLYLPKDGPDDGVTAGDLQSQGVRSTGSYPVRFAGREYRPLPGNHWKVTEEGMARLIKADRVIPLRTVLRFKRRAVDFPAQSLPDVWVDTSGGAGADKVYAVQTSTKLIERCVLMGTDPGDLVLDLTCGSGTTAQVCEQWGRRWITTDTSRVALAIARTRLMAATYPYYLLADSREGLLKEAELAGTAVPVDAVPEADVAKGYVYRRVPHIQLKSISANPEIDDIVARWQGKLEPTRDALNRALGEAWDERDIPRAAGPDWTDEAARLLAEWWDGCEARQAEIEASIARHSPSEMIYDQPYEDPKRMRVTGPFTVESLSPHRVLSSDLTIPKSEAVAQKDADVGQFEVMILDNLRRSGVQNTIKDERLQFDRLDVYPGKLLQAEGTYAEKDGAMRRAAVCIAPRYDTVGIDLIRNAAKEAVKGFGFDVLVVCGFAFDAHVREETPHYGRLDILTVHMNPDLMMGPGLLKATGTGNLFMLIGEPDVEVRAREGKVVVAVRGVDVYDPTTGQIRNSSTDDVACWFIDTDYNEESFFVRHAYFSGADDPYGKLRRALRAEIDVAAWAQLYATESIPFDPPSTGKIAVKVITYYGDEVLKVYTVADAVTAPGTAPVGRAS